MSQNSYCEVALPVPLDRTFTYAVSAGLRGEANPGARVVAPFGPRKLSGVVTSVHGKRPDFEVRELIRVLDNEPALTEQLLELGAWIAEYYCAPIGEVLKSMLPLGSEVRQSKTLELSPAGRAAAERFRKATGDDPTIRVLQSLEARALNETYLKRKVPGSGEAIEALKRQGYVNVRDEVEGRDPLRARSGRYVVSAGELERLPKKSPKGERWLVEHLAKDPGPHELESLAIERKDVPAVARRLAREGIVKLEIVRERAAAATKAATVQLNEDQASASKVIADALAGGEYRAFLLRGVTGSGKTEVYMQAIDEGLSRGKTALLLVPEIGLTPAVAAQFFARFGDQVAILHSAFTGWQRAQQWRRIRAGDARVVVGTRSAVFAPLPELGLVIVDEEHESTYKQEENPRYHGRDVAVMRAMKAKATVVLGSATPSLESSHNVERKKYSLLEMPERIEKRPLPEVEVVDMREEFVETRSNDLFSRSLVEQLESRLATKQQAMILLNRRGFSMFAMCRKCGHRVECQNCSVTLTFHRRDQRLLCHYCDYAEPVPETCSQCNSEHIYFQGSGSEKVEEELRKRFPKARIARLDRDSVKGREHYEAILGGFREGSYDFLVGTQMIAKGHDIPNVTLVGVVSADVGLGIPDFRAAERTFQLLTQVAGRAGRGERPGKVVLQTMNPEHWAIKLAARHDYAEFYKREKYFRRQMQYPPFSAMATLLVRSKRLEEALSWSGKLGAELQTLPEGVVMLGPAAAPLHKLKTEYRYQFLLKARRRPQLRKAIQRARDFARDREWPATALLVDVDPMSLL